MPVRTRVKLNVEDYLAIERKAETRSEFLDGEMFAMTGASRVHNLLVANLLAALHRELLARDCTVYPSDMRVKVEKTGLYTYPDVVVTCGAERLEDEHGDTLLNPVAIFEVLSSTTEAYDRGAKFEHYQQLDSLAEYVLIAQDKVRVEQFVRQGGGRWLYFEAHERGARIALQSLGIAIELTDIYAKAGF